MTQIILEPLTLVARGSLASKIKRITTMKVGLNTDTQVASKVIKLVKSSTGLGANTTITAVKSLVIKHIKSNANVKASLKGESHKFKTVSTSITTQSTFEAFTYERDIAASFNGYLPQFYAEFDDVAIMMQSEINEITRLLAKVETVIDQPFINTATYTLDRWERMLGIEPVEARSLDSRRHFILSKLRGLGTITQPLLKDIVDAFYYSEITEIPNELTVKIKLLGKRGIPKNLEDINVAVTDVIPAHTQAEYEFSYLTWGEVEEYGLTWEEANKYTNEQIAKIFLLDPGYDYEN